MAEIMHLDSCTLGESSIIARETAQRTWWSLYVADRWCFSGLGLPRHMDHLAASVDLPLDELTFRSLAPEQSSLDTPRKPGLWAYMITLVRLFGPIQDLNRRAANSESETAELDKAVKDLGQQLEGWSENLPVDIQFTVQNLHSYQHNSLGGLFIALHLAYHHYSSLLYFRFLEASQGSSSPRNLYVSRCKHHASSFSGLLQLSRQLNGCEVLYPTVGQMITVSSAVLLHTMLFGESEELPRARRELSANFEALVELQQYWPATTAMVSILGLPVFVSFSTRRATDTDAGTDQQTHDIPKHMSPFDRIPQTGRMDGEVLAGTFTCSRDKRAALCTLNLQWILGSRQHVV